MSVDVELLSVKGPPRAARRVFELDLLASRRDVTFLLSISFSCRGWAKFNPLGNDDLALSHPLFSFNSRIPAVKWNRREGVIEERPLPLHPWSCRSYAGTG